jgi:hypothetical protein
VATIGPFLDLFSGELGYARGSLVAKTQEMRGAGMLTGARGNHAEHLNGTQAAHVLLMAVLFPDYTSVAETIRRVGALPYNAAASHPGAFRNLTVAGAPTVAEAMERLINDAAEGRMAAWKGDLFVDFVDGAYVEISTRRSTGEPGVFRESTLAFGHPGTAQIAPSLFRISRVDSRIFHQIAALMAGKVKPRIVVS